MRGASSWRSARRGRAARDAAIQAILPMIAQTVTDLGEERVRAALPVLRDLRLRFGDEEA